MIGVFVELYPGRARSPGWIIDGNGCHIWVGARTRKGYATVWDPARRTKTTAYRFRYEREIGPIPEGMELDHYVCSNGAGGCCNPLHCRPVTSRENNLRSDGLAAVETAKTQCPLGHPLSGANLLPAFLRRGQRCCRECALMSRRSPQQRARRTTDEHRAKVRERYRQTMTPEKRALRATKQRERRAHLRQLKRLTRRRA